MMVYANQPADLVYGMVKAMIVTYAGYKDGAPGADGFEVSRQNLAWVLPYHEGAVRAFREAGAWKPEHEAHNQGMLKRQQVLGDAWNAYLKTNPSDAAFNKGWVAARAAALTKAGLPTIFD
jgi:hypothetical protein